MNGMLKAVLGLVLCVFATSCVWHTTWYENGNKKEETITIDPDIQLEMKPDGTIKARVKATGEDGVERDAETIDTDNDGEADVLWFPGSDGDMSGGGVGFPIV